MAYFTYLISSLPSLKYRVEPPLTSEAFLSRCETSLAAKDLELLKAILEGGKPHSSNTTLRLWHAFDTALRNELVKVRASSDGEAKRFLRESGTDGMEITHMALYAYRRPSIMEAEEFLDEARWSFLDRLALGHYFDLDALIVYAEKLAILQKWSRVSSADGRALAEDILGLVGGPRQKEPARAGTEGQG